MKFIALIALTLQLSATAQAESLANSAFEFMTSRYRDAKLDASTNNGEIRLACLGEVFKGWVRKYDQVVETERLNKSKITNYDETLKLVELHSLDVDNIYHMLRSNMIDVLRDSLREMRASKQIPDIPNMTVQQYHLEKYDHNLSICNDERFVQKVAMAAPISNGLDTVVESTTVIAMDDDFSDFDGILSGESPTTTGPGVEYKQVSKTLEEWLFEISKR
ncbi:MAG: hypothetical protein H6626_06920 [Pseudobdellovibrionaceae bacterium]|nr:hypothetical protein [Bdellovibrionales bacterium]USN48815.1 MAG: hypothetical protein H6626_06920 [Pseudobdellovibrionaceae bacterium]